MRSCTRFLLIFFFACASYPAGAVDASPGDCAMAVELPSPALSQPNTLKQIAVFVPGRVLALTASFVGEWSAPHAYLELSAGVPLVRVLPDGVGNFTEVLNPIPPQVGAMMLDLVSEIAFTGYLRVTRLVIQFECEGSS